MRKENYKLNTVCFLTRRFNNLKVNEQLIKMFNGQKEEHLQTTTVIIYLHVVFVKTHVQHPLLHTTCKYNATSRADRSGL